MLRIVAAVALVASLSLADLCSASPSHQFTRQSHQQNYDYTSLAIGSILSAAEEVRKLPDIGARVTLIIKAAKLLEVSKRSDAIRLLDIAWKDLKGWESETKVGRGQRHKAAGLRSEVLSVYAKLDLEKATALQKEDQPDNASTDDITKFLRPDGKWSSELTARRAPADQAAKIALSLLETEPDRASALIVQSVEGGIVSSTIVEIFQKLQQSGKRDLLNKLEVAVGQTLAATTTLDDFSLTFASHLVYDPEMPAAARSGFIRFFMNSVEVWAALIKREDGNGGLDSSYVGSSFMRFFINVRPVIAKYAPGNLLRLDVLFDQVSPFVPDKTKSMLAAFQPETLSDPKDRLNDILKDPSPQKRDQRLIRLVSELLRKERTASQTDLDDLTAQAISGFSDPDFKSAFTDLLTIVRMDALVKQNKFIEAQRLAGSIPSEETRAWALLALSTVAAKADRVLGFELIGNALTALEKASPSPRKVELALIATAMLTKDDPQRAFETMSAASRYANSSAAKVDPPTKPLVAFGLEATIGASHTRLGVSPESLSELEIDPLLSTLGITDWFRAEQIANDIREPALRLRLKLQFAEAVLASKPKPKVKGAPTTPPTRKEIH